MTRNPLLPVLDGSRAVLVGRDVPEPDVDYGFGRGWESAELATMQLSQVLLSPAHQVFEMTSVAKLVGDPSPAEVIAAMRGAAAAVSDTLLFSYCATGPVNDQSELATVAQIMRDSAATRLVVLLDCSDFASTVSHFLHLVDAEPDRVSLLAGARSMLFTTEIDPLTSNLAEAIAVGIDGGPEALDLVSLRDAVRDRHTELREAVEDEWLPGEKSLICLAGDRVALGINPALPPSGAQPRRREAPRSTGPLRDRSSSDETAAATVLVTAIRAAAPAAWTSEANSAAGAFAVREPTADNEKAKRYVLIKAGAGRLKVIHRGGISGQSTSSRIMLGYADQHDQNELFVRQLHVDGVFPARGFSATAAVHVPFPRRDWCVEVALRALIALRVTGWTATVTSDSAGVRWKAQDPEDRSRSVSIEKQPGDEGGDVIVIGTATLGVEQRILLPLALGKDMGFKDVPALEKAVEALTVMGILPVEAQWGITGVL
ncbi:MAG TPA: hypothetical protein VN408_20755 [Actinoplanes sp.]|nr:hypothetical protein [Actinoplanes sp.]